MKFVFSPLAALLFLLLSFVNANLWTELERVSDLAEWRRVTAENRVARFYMDDSQAKITVFAPIDEVFIRYDTLMRNLEQGELLAHFVDIQVPEISGGRRWDNPVLLRNSVKSGKVFITQFENNPNNFSYFANNGRVCNHVTPSWNFVSGNQWLYKICSPIGHQAYPASALSFIAETDPTAFQYKRYDNKDLTLLLDTMRLFPLEANLLYGDSTFSHLHTFFLPNNDAFRKIADRNQITREIVMAHVTMPGFVLFTEAWLYDYGVHKYPSILIDQAGFIRDNPDIRLCMRNITDRKTGRWQIYIVSEVYRQYSVFRRGAVWSKVVQPNIPVSNGVVHVIDTVLGVVTNTIDQIINAEPRLDSLNAYINAVGMLIRSYFSAQAGMVTFFAPLTEAFDRIPDEVEKRLLRDRIWLEQILRLHIVPSTQLTSDQITNNTRVNTIDNLRQLYFIKGEWPINNITFYVIGGGITAALIQEDIGAVNGIVHYIDRVLGVPYQTMYQVIRNETTLQESFKGIRETNLRYTLDPWEVIRPEQNFTFFVPTDEAWQKHPVLKQKFHDGAHWQALQFVYKRHMIQGQALMLTDLREKTYVMMNDQRVTIRRRGRWFELYWPYGNRVAQIIEGGEIACTNGFMHKIDNIFILEEDLKAGSAHVVSELAVVLLCLFLCRFGLGPRPYLFLLRT